MSNRPKALRLTKGFKMQAEKKTIYFGSGEGCQLIDNLTIHAEEKLKAMIDDKEDAAWSFSARAGWNKAWDALRLMDIKWTDDEYFITFEYVITNPGTRQSEIEAVRIRKVEID